MSLVTSIQRGGSNNHETTSEEANGVYTDFVSEGVLGTTANTSGVAPATGGWAVNAQGTPDMTVAVGAGTAYVTATPSTQASQTFRIVSSAEEDVTISANSSGSTKYDWLYLKLDATTLNAPNVAGDDAATLVTSRSSSITSDDGTPPTYGILLAVITVANGAVSITNGNIKDSRTQASIGASTSDSTGWFNLGATPNTITNNGNRSYDMVFNSVDLTGYLSAGQRLRLTRTVSAPTYMGGLFNGSSHYFTKVTCTSTLSTVTNNFTLMAHVEPTSYAIMIIAARADSTPNNGILLYMNASGQVVLGIRNAAGANYREVATYQSLPLNKKTLVAASWTSGTVVIYFDGVSVPVSAATTGGTAPTTAGTGGDFSIGRLGAASLYYWAGYISNVAVFDAVLSASTVRSLMSQDIAVGATNCIGSWNLNNTGVNQQAAGTNDLTATGGVSYTVRSPYGNYLGGTLEYAIITKTAFSTNTTLTVQVPEGCAIPTSGGVSAVAYSTQDVPYLFPKRKGQWRLSSIWRIDSTTTSNATYGAFQSGGWKLNVPIGSFDTGWQGTVYNQTSTEVTMAISSTALTGLTQAQGNAVTKYAVPTVSAAAATAMIFVNINNNEALSAATDFVFYTLGATTSAGLLGARGFAEIYAEFGLL